MLYTRNMNTIIVGAVFLLTFSASAISAADTKESSHQHQSGQAAGHGDAKSGDHHGHQCGHKMSAVDLNKDGKISKEEFMKHHETMFDKKDTNKDGFLDDTEMHHMMDHMHKHSHSKEGDHAPSDTKK